MKIRKPKVSILIPVYNRETIIRETLECAINQKYDDFEIVIIDNCSTDHTYEIMEEYQKKNNRVKIFKNKENLGPVKNWKEGLEKCQGEYCKILWSDDQISLDYLKITVPILENNKSIGFVYTKTIRYSKEKKETCYRYGETGKYKSIDFIDNCISGEKNTPVSPGCALFRTKDLIENLEIEIENPKKMVFSKYGAGNDLLLFLKTYPKYENFYFLDEVKSYFRAHEGSFSVSNKLDEYYVYSKFYYLINIDDEKINEIRNNFLTFLSIKKKYRYMIKSVSFEIKINLIIKKIKNKIKYILKKL